MLAVRMKNLGYQGKVDDGVLIELGIVTDVLELEVAVRVTDLVDDF